MKLWLDDVREPPHGWVWVKSVEEAKAVLLAGSVVEMSLDHDLGVGPSCERCLGFSSGYYIGTCPGEGGCECFCHEPYPTGYDLVKWMAETGNWPKRKPQVHSMNVVGRQNMLETIERYFGTAPTGRTGV